MNNLYVNVKRVERYTYDIQRKRVCVCVTISRFYLFNFPENLLCWDCYGVGGRFFSFLTFTFYLSAPPFTPSHKRLLYFFCKRVLVGVLNFIFPFQMKITFVLTPLYGLELCLFFGRSGPVWLVPTNTPPRLMTVTPAPVVFRVTLSGQDLPSGVTVTSVPDDD